MFMSNSLQHDPIAGAISITMVVGFLFTNNIIYVNEWITKDPQKLYDKVRRSVSIIISRLWESTFIGFPGNQTFWGGRDGWMGGWVDRVKEGWKQTTHRGNVVHSIVYLKLLFRVKLWIQWRKGKIIVWRWSRYRLNVKKSNIRYVLFEYRLYILFWYASSTVTVEPRQTNHL